MGWDFKHSNLFGAKIWLDSENRRILLTEAFGRNKREFDFSEVKSVHTGKARTSNNHMMFLTVKDLKKPEYGIEFSTKIKLDEWFSRLQVALDLDLR